MSPVVKCIGLIILVAFLHNEIGDLIGYLSQGSRVSQMGQTVRKNFADTARKLNEQQRSIRGGGAAAPNTAAVRPQPGQKVNNVLQVLVSALDVFFSLPLGPLVPEEWQSNLWFSGLNSILFGAIFFVLLQAFILILPQNLKARAYFGIDRTSGRASKIVRDEMHEEMFASPPEKLIRLFIFLEKFKFGPLLIVAIVHFLLSSYVGFNLQLGLNTTPAEDIPTVKLIILLFKLPIGWLLPGSAGGLAALVFIAINSFAAALFIFPLYVGLRSFFAAFLNLKRKSAVPPAAAKGAGGKKLTATGGTSRNSAGVSLAKSVFAKPSNFYAKLIIRGIQHFCVWQFLECSVQMGPVEGPAGQLLLFAANLFYFPIAWLSSERFVFFHSSVSEMFFGLFNSYSAVFLIAFLYQGSGVFFGRFLNLPQKKKRVRR